MQKLALNFRGKSFRKFSSVCQFVVYNIDILIKIAIIGLLTFAGLAHEAIISSTFQLSAYALIYSSAILVWGLLLTKSILCGKKVFGKTRFDLYFMGIITIALISVLLSSDRITGVFGSSSTWSYSVMTFLSLSIIYYVTVLLFKYPRGIKWLSLALTLSVLIPGIYYISLTLKKEVVGVTDYMTYVVLIIPLSISIIFILRKTFLKILAFLALLCNLFLVAFYSNFLQGALFVLGIGVLSLFLLFYISFWTKNSLTIINFVKKVLSQPKNIKKIISKNKKATLFTLVVIFIAFWIIGFATFSMRFFKVNFGGFLGEWIREDFAKVEGFKMWTVGENNLSQEFSSLEAINILANYGILEVLIFLVLFIHTIIQTAKLTLKLLYAASWRNIIFASSLFITIVSLFINFLVARFSPMIYLLLIVTLSFLAIINDLLNKKDLYILEKCKERVSSKLKIIQIVSIILILALTIAGVLGLLASLDKELFWGKI